MKCYMFGPFSKKRMYLKALERIKKKSTEDKSMIRARFNIQELP